MPPGWCGSVYDENGNLCPILTAFANIAAGTTDGSIVAAVTGKKIRILGYTVMCGATATTFVFNSKPAGAGNAIGMTLQNAANGGVERSASAGTFLFQTNPGEGLTATTGAGSTVGVNVTYIAT